MSRVTSSSTTHSCSSLWNISTTLHQPSRGSPTARLLSDLGSCGTTCNLTLTSRRSSSWHSNSAPIGCHYPSSWGRRQHAAGCTQTEIARCNNRFAPVVRLPRQRGRACNYRTRALCHVRSLLSDDLADSGVQHRDIQARLLQRHAVRCARHHLRHPATGSEQLGQSCLPARRSNRC